MGRPPSITGTIMSGYVLECELLVNQAKRTAHATLKKKSTNPHHYIAGIGELLEQLEGLHLAVRNIHAILDANGELPAGVDDPTLILTAITKRVNGHAGGPDVD
ncbi:MAG: hypothetical protein ACOCXI_13930 [Chloroflexota bacterium]